MGDPRPQSGKSSEIAPFLLQHPHIVTVPEFLLSHQLFPEALGRGELVVGWQAASVNPCPSSVPLPLWVEV